MGSRENYTSSVGQHMFLNVLYVIKIKIKVVFIPSSYNVSASCIIIYNQTVCLFQYIQIKNYNPQFKGRHI